MRIILLLLLSILVVACEQKPESFYIDCLKRCDNILLILPFEKNENDGILKQYEKCRDDCKSVTEILDGKRKK